MNRALVIEMQDTNNDTIQRTITYANPEASNSALLEFITDIISLTTNTFIQAKKVDTSILM